ncbi:MAG: hypothetical protein DWQ20_01330 [Actinobacteria bacterium]|nr:MAG: hypothetical protein DWQ20_01330 [Actinomycetota bacterium]
MIKRLAVVSVLLAACSTGSGSTTTAPEVTTTLAETTTTAGSTSSTEPPVQCPAAPYELTTLPSGVGEGILDPDTIPPDVWTSIGGTHTTFWGRPDGTVAIALIRGTLPAIDWPGDKGEVFVDGTRAAVGPHPDGTWVMGWFEEPRARCDLYTMVFYPPVTPPEVESTIEGMVRVAG